MYVSYSTHGVLTIDYGLILYFSKDISSTSPTLQGEYIRQKIQSPTPYFNHPLCYRFQLMPVLEDKVEKEMKIAV